MRIAHYPIDPIIRQEVDHFWYVEEDRTTGAQGAVIVPDGHVEIAIHVGLPIDRLCQNGRRVTHARSMICGQLTRAPRAFTRVQVRMVGIRFHPWAVRARLGAPVATFTDTIAPLEDAIGRSGKILERWALEANGPAGYFAAMERWARDHFSAERTPLRWFSCIVDELRYANGRTDLGLLARRAGVSHRRLDRVFENEIGLPPQLYARIHRLQRTIRSRRQNPSWSLTRLAHENGYFDQSHFNREFGDVVGLTPSAFFRQCAGLSELFIAE
jgi:methylphosphotriester-DNA--protein-cysteine methyltransferase